MPQSLPPPLSQTHTHTAPLCSHLLTPFKHSHSCSLYALRHQINSEWKQKCYRIHSNAGTLFTIQFFSALIFLSNLNSRITPYTETKMFLLGTSKLIRPSIVLFCVGVFYFSKKPQLSIHYIDEKYFSHSGSILNSNLTCWPNRGKTVHIEKN